MAICLHDGQETPRPRLLFVFQSSRQVRQKSCPQAPEGKGQVTEIRNPSFAIISSIAFVHDFNAIPCFWQIGGKQVSTRGPRVASGLTHDGINQDVLTDGALKVSAL